MEPDEILKQTLDGAVGVGALTWPLWVRYFEVTGWVVTFVGGLVLLGVRIAIGVYDLRERRKRAREA